MLYSIVTSLFCFISIRIVSSQNLNGIFIIDSCQCTSSSETCDPKGPFIFNQKRSAISINYGSLQVGVASLGDEKIDLYLNQNRCKGLWNGKAHMAELKCEHKGGVNCSTNLRCISGACLNDESISMSSSPLIKLSISLLFMISILIMLV